MKKTYQKPVADIVVVQTLNMIAESLSTSISKTAANEEARSRWTDGELWDTDDE